MRLNYAFVISFVGHLTVLLLMISYVKMLHIEPPLLMAQKMSAYISSYNEKKLSHSEMMAMQPFREPIANTLFEEERIKHIATKKILKPKAVTNQTKTTLHLKSQSLSQETQSPMHHAGKRNDELVAFLHAAIQARQRYPIAALQMERHGRVSVRFVLYQNGSISHLRIAKSSGTASLDEAAITAVNDAAPFTDAKNKLKNAQEYSIDVVFELTE